MLPEAAGYAIVLGFGVFFSIFTSLLVWLDQRYNGVQMTSEQFNTAGRSVRIGLTASVIVSQWTWAATLLQSSNVAWQYGLSGPFWYAAGASIQVLLFGILAIEIKVKAPTAHTFLELVYARWGKTAHITFMVRPPRAARASPPRAPSVRPTVLLTSETAHGSSRSSIAQVYAILCNLIVSAMLLLGGAAVTNALTGLNIYLASFLIPWGVIAYTLAGGLKATFLASYMNTAIIFGVLIYLCAPATQPRSPRRALASAAAVVCCLYPAHLL